MTSETSFSHRLTKIDDLMLADHVYLSSDDECYFIGEYTARKGYGYSITNSLVSNFKKEMDRKDRPEWTYKEQAITEAAMALRTALAPMGQEALNMLTFVPMPPSKSKEDPLYDDRLTKMLHLVRPDPKLDIREIIIQKRSTGAAHTSDLRPGPPEIMAVYETVKALTRPAPHVIVIVDDVLTTGAHFRAAQMVLSSSFPATKIVGLFIARRVPDTSGFDGFEL